MIKKIIKKIILKNKYDSKTYCNYLRSIGCHIGQGTTIFSPRNTIIDETRPFLINIGDNVQITDGVTILTHGYDWAVINGKYGDILGSSGAVKIGNNCFIGVKSTILKGVTIGNNVIIGANSLVNKDIPSNVVVAGNPAKIIMSIEEYYKKRLQRQQNEAEELFVKYYEAFKQIPDEKIFREFVFLFNSRSDKILENDVFNEIANVNNNFYMTYEKFMNTKDTFNSFDEFKRYCLAKYNIKESSK